MVTSMALGPELLCPHSKRLNAVARRRLKEALARRGGSHGTSQAPAPAKKQPHKQRSSSMHDAPPAGAGASLGSPLLSPKLSRAPSVCSQRDQEGGGAACYDALAVPVTTDSVLCDAVLEGTPLGLRALPRGASQPTSGHGCEDGQHPGPGRSLARTSACPSEASSSTCAAHDALGATGWVLLQSDEFGIDDLEDFIVVPSLATEPGAQQHLA